MADEARDERMRRTRAAVAWFWIGAVVLAAAVILVEAKWHVDLAAGLTVILTAALVWATWRYTRATERMADTQREQVSEFLLANRRDSERRTRERVAQVWAFGIEHVDESRSLTTQMDVWLERGTDGLAFIARNDSWIEAKAQEMLLTARSYYAMSFDQPEALRIAIEAHRAAMEEFGYAVKTVVRAVSSAANACAEATPAGLPTFDDVEAALRTHDDGRKGVERLWGLRDGSLGEASRESHKVMMHAVMSVGGDGAQHAHP